MSVAPKPVPTANDEPFELSAEITFRAPALRTDVVLPSTPQYAHSVAPSVVRLIVPVAGACVRTRYGGTSGGASGTTSSVTSAVASAGGVPSGGSTSPSVVAPLEDEDEDDDDDE